MNSSGKKIQRRGGASDKTIVEEYNELLHKYQEEYGNKIVLLYQVGSFMEIYAVKSPVDGSYIENAELENISAITGLTIAEKKQTCPIILEEEDGRICAAPVYMAGFRDYVLEKYLNIFSEAGYTSIVYNQHPRGGEFVRKFECIVSRGTHISHEESVQVATASNYIMCIWIERATVRQKSQIIVGLSTTNIFTGKSYFFEYISTTAEITPSTFDELERQISTFLPSEIIFITNLNEEQTKTVLKYANVKSDTLIHNVDIDTNEKAQNCTKQRYIAHTLKTYLDGGDNILQTCIEFQSNTFATQSFCYLLDFIHEHNPKLIKNITMPIMQNTSTRMVLGNQTLKQLNLIEDGGTVGATGAPTSILQFLNKTCTPMGRRLFHQQFVNPVFDENWLNEQYELTNSALLGGDAAIDMARQILNSIKDIEKICRQITIRKIFPNALYGLYASMREISTLYRFIQTPGNFENKFCEWCIPDEGIEKIDELMAFFDKHVFVEICKTTASMTTFDTNIFRSDIFPDLDEVAKKYDNYRAEFNEIYEFLNKLMEKDEKDAVKIHETEKSGLSFQITKRRGAILKKHLERSGSSEIKLRGGTGSNDEITSPQIIECSKKIAEYKEKLNTMIATKYYTFLEMLERQFHKMIENVANITAKIDVIFCKAYVAKKYNYCRPIISSTAAANGASFVIARALRHVLIEQINMNEIYVPNDVNIGTEPSGMLIYGVNTTGKTSYIRSVGIAIAMAQSGMYVPAQSFEYRPYKAIFSRILGNDNLFHGQSTFAVEMSELRVILNNADKNTLVIGDEVCSGTEIQSALSIFGAALETLYRAKCSFLFATHFHEILNFDETREMMSRGCLKVQHMSVAYDRERDCLIYERKLCDGPGYRMYGIEICKSLHMPADFIERAYQLRAKYYAETAGALSHKQSTYNVDKIRGLCEKCGEQLARETHHISPQCIADSDGIIRDVDGVAAPFHKNHLKNLMALCEKCHDAEHTPAAVPEKKRRGRPSTKKI